MSKVIIYPNDEGGMCVVYPTGEVPLADVVLNDIPKGVNHFVVEISELPTDRLFRNAWVLNGRAVGVDLDKAKEVSHERRRIARDKEMAPLDTQATIPSRMAEAEAARQVIRDKYALIQTQIDQASKVDSLTTIVQGL